ncbi:MAG: hypothetical protein M9915_06025 [Rhizobacter sp.]|nr:hypothetical protein [Rhizobacter sp.]
MSHPRLPWLLALPILAFASLGLRAQVVEICRTPDTLLERFISAECEACWSNADSLLGAPLVLDWIVPGPRGEDAPLSAAALPEAARRGGVVSEIRTRERWHALAGPGTWDVEIEDGPAWNGYIAAQLRVTREGGRRAEEVDIYIALVEHLRAGEEGSPVERMLVRSVAGPIPLDAQTTSVTHMRGFRVPQGSRPGRLTAFGWVESAGGIVLAAARVMPEACMPAR